MFVALKKKLLVTYMHLLPNAIFKKQKPKTHTTQNNSKSMYATRNYLNVMKKYHCVSLRQRKLTQIHVLPW